MYNLRSYQNIVSEPRRRPFNYTANKISKCNNKALQAINKKNNLQFYITSQLTIKPTNDGLRYPKVPSKLWKWKYLILELLSLWCLTIDFNTYSKYLHSKFFKPISKRRTSFKEEVYSGVFFVYLHVYCDICEPFSMVLFLFEWMYLRSCPI